MVFLQVHRAVVIATVAAAFTMSVRINAETLSPLKDGVSPQSVDEAWGDFDPRAEPLDVEVHKEWVEEGTVLRAVRYRIGIFKGQKSWMGALYAFPEGGENLPALVQIHGGGGLASKSACIDNAKRGYATLSVSWRADERYLEREGLPAAAQTDWGAVEGRQVAESRGIDSNNDKRFDPVPSARNSGYFLRTLAMRRGLTFLEQQPEVDGDKLGLDGHSMGGVITIQTAAMDERVKAAAPSCAPPLLHDGSLLARTANPAAYAEKINCPILFMAPSNDFHGMVEDVQWVVDHTPSSHVRIARSVHLNHKHDSETLASKELWFDSLLKGNVTYPEQPKIQVDLNGKRGKPLVQVHADDSRPIAFVDIYYARDAKLNINANNRTRLWHYVKPTQRGNRFTASLDLFDLEEPLWVFANVHYALEGGGEVHALTQRADTFIVTTQLEMFTSEALQTAQIKTKGKTTTVIEPFGKDWKKEWVTHRSSVDTWKLNDPRVPMPEYGKLVIKLTSEFKTDLNVKVGKTLSGKFPLQGGGVTETIEVYPFDLVDKNTKAQLLDWRDLNRPNLSIGSNRGVPELQKIYWQPIDKREFISKRPFQLGAAEKTDGKVMLNFQMADDVDGRFDAEGQSVKVDKSIAVGIDVKDGLQVHSQGVSEVSYFLKGEFQTFAAKLIPCFQASAVFEVHADGKKVFESDVFRGKTPPQDIEVDISGVQMLKLVVSEGGNGWGGDWVIWGSAYCK
ncbi:MAG: NPCBM/NEW2 domain-containing protein [Opitutaceae bacterium]